MPKLFSYGQLREADIQRKVFGRTVDGREARLVGYRKTMEPVRNADFAHASGQLVHAIIRPTGNPDDGVDGVALHVTEAELGAADDYEPSGYVRVTAALADGGDAWVYVDSASIGAH